MSKKHLTFDDRLAIQAGLQQGLKIAQIAKRIGKDRSTVGREIKAHRRLVASSKGNRCVHHAVCAKVPPCRPGCVKGGPVGSNLLRILRPEKWAVSLLRT